MTKSFVGRSVSSSNTRLFARKQYWIWWLLVRQRAYLFWPIRNYKSLAAELSWISQIIPEEILIFEKRFRNITILSESIFFAKARNCACQVHIVIVYESFNIGNSAYDNLRLWYVGCCKTGRVKKNEQNKNNIKAKKTVGILRVYEATINTIVITTISEPEWIYKFVGYQKARFSPRIAIRKYAR